MDPHTGEVTKPGVPCRAVDKNYEKKKYIVVTYIKEKGRNMLYTVSFVDME